MFIPSKSSNDRTSSNRPFKQALNKRSESPAVALTLGGGVFVSPSLAAAAFDCAFLSRFSWGTPCFARGFASTKARQSGLCVVGDPLFDVLGYSIEYGSNVHICVVFLYHHCRQAIQLNQQYPQVLVVDIDVHDE